MPRRSGFDFVKDLRAIPRCAALPVIALSSGVTPDALARARQLQIAEFVAKFDRSGLVAALAEAQGELGVAA
jgi:two-component system, chemotaxis family, sensor kinase CheA